MGKGLRERNINEEREDAQRSPIYLEELHLISYYLHSAFCGKSASPSHQARRRRGG